MTEHSVYLEEKAEDMHIYKLKEQHVQNGRGKGQKLLSLKVPFQSPLEGQCLP